MEDANRYLEEVYLPGHNEKFGVESREVESRFKPLPKGVDLAEVLCLHYERVINRDHTVSFGGHLYQIHVNRSQASMWRQSATIHENYAGDLKIFVNGKKYAMTRVLKSKKWCA